MLAKVFKAYDIRAIYPKPLDEGIAWQVGFATAQFLLAEAAAAGLLDPMSRTICVGRDMRKSSPSLAKELKQWMRDAGADVVDLGLVDTPFVSFAINHLGCAGGVQVTASHNPANYNGFKMMLGKKPFYGKQIQEIGRRAAEGDVVPAAIGTDRQVDVADRSYCGVAEDTDVVALIDPGVDDRYAQTIQGHHRDIGAGGGKHQVADAIPILAGVELDVGAEQLGIDEIDRIVGGDRSEGIRIGPGDRAHRRHVDGSDEVGIGSRVEFEVAAEIAQFRTVHIDTRNQRRILVDHAEVERQTTESIDTDLVDHIAVGERLDPQRAARAARGLRGDGRAFADRHPRAEALVV
jgi:hypothetical protein